MKKTQFILIAVLVLGVSLAGCSQKTGNPPDTQKSTVSARDTAEKEPEESDSEKATSSLLAGEESSSPESSGLAGENAGSASSQPKADSHAPAETQRTAETPAPKQAAAPAAEAQPEKPAIKPPVSTPQPETPAPTPTPTPAPTPEPTPQPTPTPEPPAPTEPPAPSFDVSAYVGYAQSYGQSIGLSLDSTATACWDNPINANAGCKYLERDIRDTLDWYAADGHTAFWVWSESLGGGNFQIFIGYA
ncbi:MAG: hypothetical protein PHY23_06050 [Oscillospiraceae bacterium]|nr:hypothetical protein [Oscillospiraceae bacterium]